MLYLHELKQDNDKMMRLARRQLLCKEDVFFKDPCDVAIFARDILKTQELANEQMFVFCTSSAMQIIGVVRVSIGGIDSAVVPIDKIFQSALLMNVRAIIVMHNHPSGNCAPSEEDESVTKRLIQAGNIIGVPVLDHVVVGGTKYYSMCSRESKFIK